MVKNKNYCWACAPLVSTDKKEVYITNIHKSEMEVILKRKRRLKTTKFTLFGVYDEDKPFVGTFSLFDCFTYPPISTKENPQPVIVYFEDINFGLIKSIWNEYGVLIATGINVRAFTGILMRFLYLILIFGLPVFLTKLLIFLTPSLSPYFFHIFLPLLLISGIFFKKKILPCRWSPYNESVKGTIKDYKVYKWEIAPVNIIGYKAFITLEEERGGIVNVLLEWQKSIIIREKLDDNKFEKFQISEELLEYLKKNKKMVEFIGRELFNVLVCNLDDPFCKMEIISISEEEINPSESPTS
jgi:hypothetical protein